MKRNTMKIPPLSQLYEQKIDFTIHKKKLQKIMSDRKTNLLRQNENRTQQSIIKRNTNHYSLKYNAKSLEIAKKNSKIIKKIESIKPVYVFRQSLDLSDKQSKTSHMINCRSRIAEQQRENFRLRSRVQSTNSSLNSKKLLNEYRRSIQIKERITHFKTQENKVILKAQKYLGNTSMKSYNIKSQQMFKKIIQSPQALSILDNQIGRQLLEQKLNKNVASHYNKDDIIKNKIKINNRLFKFARQKRLKTLLNQQKCPRQGQWQAPAKKCNFSLFFPTQPQKTYK